VRSPEKVPFPSVAPAGRGDAAVNSPRRRSPATPGGLVIGGDYQGLAIVRSLGRHGIPVCVVDDEFSIARVSRYCSRFVRVPSLEDDDATLRAVVEAADEFGLDGWVLYPTRDETVAAFARNRDVLVERFRLPTPGWQTIRYADDKRQTHALAEQLDIPTPRTWVPANLEELHAIDPEPPLVIKPAIKETFIYETGVKAWRADDKRELSQRFQEATAIVGEGRVLVQELIPGDGLSQYSYCAFVKHGNPLATMTARRRRQHPPQFGRASTFVETVEEPWLEQMSERFLRAIDYYGLVELEYKCDPRDGVAKLLDVNARTWGYHGLGLPAGVDFPYLLYLDQLGTPIEPVRARAGVRWVRLTTDIPTAIVEILGRRLSIGSYLRSLKGVDAEAVFSVTDPLPTVLELALLPYLYFKRGF
jgi:D-aspartate ligase